MRRRRGGGGGREMHHQLCCIAVECPNLPDDDDESPDNRADCIAFLQPEHDSAVAGVLYKWTNFGKGWRSRWFSLRRDGLLSYSKIRRRSSEITEKNNTINNNSISNNHVLRGTALVGPLVHIKISSFRESKSDDRRFYIFSAKKTLQLRSESSKDRVAWIEALISARCSYAVHGKIPISYDDVAFSTLRLRDRLRAEGLHEELIQECERIMQSEFSEVHRQLANHYEEQLTLLSTSQEQLEEANGSLRSNEAPLQLLKQELSGSAHEYSTTESSDEVEKQDLEELSDEDDPCFFDTMDNFIYSSASCVSPTVTKELADETSRERILCDSEAMQTLDASSSIRRRQKLPKPIEKERSVSLWSIIKDNIGKDLTRVCLPVYFNEPLSSLQKCCEDLEYSCLLDQAYDFGKKGDSLMRILCVAAFAVSGYASCVERPCKPFNPLLGETYEADYPEKGIRFFSEKVSHHPTLIACHCEGRGWKFWGDSNLKSKFWGRSIQLDPLGILTLEFDDGEVFQWSKVTTTIYNLILGRVYCVHHGVMTIKGNRHYTCKLKFKERSLLDQNPRHVHGFVEDVNGNKVATLSGKWDDSMYYSTLVKESCSTEENILLWKKSEPPADPTRYNLTSFAVTLNELTSELQEKLPPTDSRLRPDQRHLENGEYEKANAEKLRLEERQRMSRKMQENGWQPRWFRKDDETGTYQYIGGYWETREERKWDGCPNIFGERSDELNDSHVSHKCLYRG